MMRTGMRHCGVGCALLASSALLLACDDMPNTTMQDFSVTMDMTMPPIVDMPPTGDMAGPTDLVPGPDITTFSGQVIFTELLAKAAIPLADGGTMIIPVKTLNPSVGWNGAFTDDLPGPLINGCSANHFNIPGNDLPPAEISAGIVKITGYTGGMTLTGLTVPTEINCLPTASGYQCGYGPVDADAGVSLIPTGAVAFPPNSSPLGVKDQVITMTGTGGMAAAFNTMNNVKVGGDVVVKNDLDTITFDPAADTTVSIGCPEEVDGGVCSATIMAVSVLFDQNDPNMVGGASPTAGAITCTAIGGNATVKKEAIRVARGCDNMGMNCDTALKSVRTVVLRFPFPPFQANGNTYVAGHGAVGAHLLP